MSADYYAKWNRRKSRWRKWLMQRDWLELLEIARDLELALSYKAKMEELQKPVDPFAAYMEAQMREESRG